MTKNTLSNLNKNTFWFNLLVLYLVFDYGRLHETLRLGFARPLMILMIVFIVMIINNVRLSNLRNKQIKLLMLFILLLSLHIPFARNINLAYLTTQSMFLYMPFIISTIICLNTIERFRKFILFCVLIMAYISLYAITHNGYGPGNYFLDENDLSLYIVIWIPICYYLFFDEQNRFNKLIYAVSFVLGLIAIVISFSRGGFIGLIVAFFVIWLFTPRKFLSIIIITSIILLIFIFADPAYRAEMKTVTDTKESTATNRIESWKSAWKMFEDHPFGVGGNNFPVWFSDYQIDFFKRGMWGTVAHSLWFTLIPELGIGGIIIFSLLLFYNIRDILFFKNVHFQNENKDMIYLNNLGRAFIGAMAGFFASATFISVLYYAHYWYMTGLIVAVVNVANQIKATEDANSA